MEDHWIRRQPHHVPGLRSAVVHRHSKIFHVERHGPRLSIFCKCDTCGHVVGFRDLDAVIGEYRSLTFCAIEEIADQLHDERLRLASRAMASYSEGPPGCFTLPFHLPSNVLTEALLSTERSWKKVSTVKSV